MELDEVKLENTLQEQIRIHIDALLVLEKDLRAYCHEENCPSSFQCPDACGCKKVTDLDTSTAWCAANIVNGFKNTALKAPRKDYHVTILQSLVRDLYCCLDIVSYHVEKYTKLFDYLNDARYHMKEITFLINMLKKEVNQ